MEIFCTFKYIYLSFLYLPIISVKVFEIEAANVCEVLMQGKYDAGGACSRKNLTQNAVESVETVQKKKLGRPVTTHRRDDDELFKALGHNADGCGIKRKEWQVAKCEKFKSG